MNTIRLFRKSFLSLFWLMPLFVYALIYLDQRPLWAIRALAGFTTASENLVLWGSLFLFGILVLSSFDEESTPHEGNMQHNYLWSISTCALFVLLVSLVVYVNPHGRYPWNPYPFTTTAAHYQKIALYNRLQRSPQAVILGSSRSYTISAVYTAQLLDKDTFNMAVGSAGPIDQLTLARYITKDKTEIPRLLIVELVATDLGTSAWQNYMPLNLLPYLSANQMPPVVKSIFLDTLSLRSLTDAVFLLTNRNAREYITFLPDGMGQRSERSETFFYQNNVKRQIPAVFKQNTCANLDVEGQKAINRLVEFAEDHKIGIVFYRSPINAEFFEHANLDDPRYKRCQKLFSEYMQNLIDAHPNVFYVDLFYYEPISSLREAGYIDVQHLYPQASNLVIDALHDDMQKALGWVGENR